MSRPEFGPETTITVGELKEGDFVIVVPTQEGLRGTEFESGVLKLTPVELSKSIGGRRRVTVPGMAIKTHRSRSALSGGTCYPLHFKVKVRRLIQP